MKQHMVSLSDLQHVATTSHVQGLIRDMAKHLQEEIQNNLASLPAQDRWSLRHLIIQAELGLALLTAIEEVDYKLIEQTLYLTPLQTLWIAWRVKRREKKNMKQVLL
jgi:phytoene synthase